MSMEAELKAFDEQLVAERLAMLEEHSRRRAEFTRQLDERARAEAEKAGLPYTPLSQAQAPAAAEAAVLVKPEPKKKEAHTGPCGTEQAGKTEKCSGCSSKDACSSGKGSKDETTVQIQLRMSMIEHKILVLSGKGGVGKSMVSSQLAFALAARGYLVGLLDVDICGPTVPKMLGKRGTSVVRTPEGLSPVQVTDKLTAMSIGFLVEDDTEAVIWRGPRKMGLITTFLRDVSWGALDFLIVDTPPGTSDEHLSTVQLLGNTGIDGAVVVTSPQDVSVIEVGKEINFCRRLNIPVLGVVENFASFACPMCSSVTCIWPATSGGGRHLAEQHNVPFLGSVPLDPALARMGDAGKAIADASSPVGKVIYSVADNIIDKFCA